MTAAEVLRDYENQFNGSGSIAGLEGAVSKKGLGVVLFVTLIILVIVGFVSAGNLIPAGIAMRAAEYINEQFSANNEMVKIQVISVALRNGSLGENTITRLKQNGVEVYYDNNGELVEVSFNDDGQPDKMVPSNNIEGQLTSANSANLNGVMNGGTNTPMVIVIDGQTISSEDFPKAVMNNAKLLDAVDGATYGDALYWYDESISRVLSDNGVYRNNFNKDDEDFATKMDEIVGKGSDIEVEGFTEEQREEEDENGEIITRTYIESDGMVGSNNASTFTSGLGQRSKASSSDQATINAASTASLSVTVTNTAKSMRYAMGYLENIDKMRAGYGGILQNGSDTWSTMGIFGDVLSNKETSRSQINEVMNSLFRTETVPVYNVATGETEMVTGSMVEAPSLYSILSGEKIELQDVENYSNESALKAVASKGYSSKGSNSFASIVASVGSKSRGLIGRLMGGLSSPDASALQAIEPIIDSALINNSFSDLKGVVGGEMMAMGFTELGNANATISGGTSGDKEAVLAYRKLTDQVLALRAEADRMKRSPFDITSKNTFLGSILYKFAISSMKSGAILNKFASISKVAANALSSLIPSVKATNEVNDAYLTTFGDCERFEGMHGAVGSDICAPIATFDVNNYGQISNMGSEFYEVVGQNVTCNENGLCNINEGSDFAKFLNHIKKVTPDGVIDASLMGDSTQSGSSSFTGNLIGAIRNLFFGADDEKKEIASGAAFVNSSSNKYWNKYKYAQLYCSYVRVVEDLGVTTQAYINMPFVGVNNPVLAYLEQLDGDTVAVSGE